jgi:hypothetical protein
MSLKATHYRLLFNSCDDGYDTAQLRRRRKPYMSVGLWPQPHAVTPRHRHRHENGVRIDPRDWTPFQRAMHALDVTQGAAYDPWGRTPKWDDSV